MTHTGTDHASNFKKMFNEYGVASSQNTFLLKQNKSDVETSSDSEDCEEEITFPYTSIHLDVLNEDENDLITVLEQLCSTCFKSHSNG